MLAKRQCHRPAVRLLCTQPCFLSISLHLSEDQLEDVVEDVEASGAIRQKLECLAVVHGSLLLIDLNRSLC